MRPTTPPPCASLSCRTHPHTHPPPAPPTHPHPTATSPSQTADPHCIPFRRLNSDWWDAAQPNDVDCTQHCVDFNERPGSTVDVQCLGIVEMQPPPTACNVLDVAPLLGETRCYLQVPSETKGSSVTSTFYYELNAALDECGDPCRAAPPPAHTRDTDNWKPGQHMDSVGQPGNCSPTVKATGLDFCGSEGHMPPPFPPRLLPPPAPPVQPWAYYAKLNISRTFDSLGRLAPARNRNNDDVLVDQGWLDDDGVQVEQGWVDDRLRPTGQSLIEARSAPYPTDPDSDSDHREILLDIKRTTPDDSTRSTFLDWAQWILLPLCILLAAVLVLVIRCCRLYSSRAANLRLSRDRAQMDLQLLTHQVESGGQTRSYAPSVPESLPARLRSYLPKAASSFGNSALSLPPGPPSSAASSAFRAAIELPVAMAVPSASAAQSVAQLLRNFVSPPVPSSEVPVAPNTCVDANLPVWLAESAAAGVAPEAEAEGSLAAEVSLAVDAFFEQNLVSEALAELATKEEEAAAQQVRAVSMSAGEAFQVRAAQQVRVASDDGSGGGISARHESPGHGSTSSEISASLSLSAQSSISQAHSSPEALFRSIPAKPQSLREKFVMHVMCDFTPRPPTDLPKSQWISYRRLVSLFQPFAPTEVWQHGPGNLKQLVTEWYKEHPAFEGLQPTAWCKLLKDKDVQPGTSSMVSKFSFQYTPKRKRSLDVT